MSVGTVFRVKKEVLKNKPGVLGICYEDYKEGLSIIFENGKSDGFSPEDQDFILEKVGHLDGFHY